MTTPILRRKLVAIRTRAGLTQRDVARISGLHLKTVSSFEHDNARLRAAKFWQIEAYVTACGMTLAEFCTADVCDLEPRRTDSELDRIARELKREDHAVCVGSSLRCSLTSEHRLHLP